MRYLQIWVNNDTNHPDDLDHDYNLITNDSTTEMQLLYSKSSEWSNPDETNSSLSDHGNGIEIVLSGRKETLNLDYAQAQELLILLTMIQDAKIEIRESKTIKTID
jgi:hypothetical protein